MLGPRASGFTLAELLSALTILAIVATLAAPSFIGSDAEPKLELAAAQISGAMQFVRSEAIRTGSPYALHSELNGDISLNALDISGAAPVLGDLLRHPVSKHYYRFNVLTDDSSAGIEFLSSTPPFTFESATGTTITARDVYFNSHGAPYYVDSGGVYYRLTSGSIGLGDSGVERYVNLAPLTGRVTVQ